MNKCNVKEVALGNKPTEDYHLTMQLPSALQCVLASLSQPIVLVLQPSNLLFGSVLPLASVLVPAAADSCFQREKMAG